MHLGRTLCSFAIALSCALGAGVAHAQTDPTLLTDRLDYLPGETVILMGYGFEPGETVDVSIAIDDDVNGVHIGDYDWMVEAADATGGFTSFWTVPLEAYGMTLRATALGLTSGRVATVTFHDNHGTHFVNFRVTGMEARVPSDIFFVSMLAPHPVTHVDVITPVNVSTTGTVSADVQVAAQTGNVFFLSTFPSTVDVTAGAMPGRYTRGVPSSPNGFVPGLSGATTTVVVPYSFNPCIINNPPTLSATDYSVQVCPEDGTVSVTVTPANFSPAYGDPDNDPMLGAVTFSDGASSKTLTFPPGASTQSLTLRVYDNPAANPLHTQTGPPFCGPIVSTFTDQVVNVVASVYEQNAPTVTANNYFAGTACGESSVTIPIELSLFDPIVTNDVDGDPVSLSLNGVTSVTLTLPANVSDAVVSAPVTIFATDNPAARDLGACAPLAPMTGSTIVYVSAHLFRNSAPLITASDANLGNLVGCLSGGTFSKSVAVSPATFGATAFDPDGDPVTLTTDISNVTLVGPGLASATVVLTATDDPTARTGGACTTPQTTTATVQVTARIVYRFDGPLFPLNWCIATKVKRGSIVPIRFRLYDCNNVCVTTVPLNPAGGPTYHTLAIAFNQANAPDGAAEVDEIGCGDSTDDFRYFLGAWTYILQTNSSYNLHTTYVIRIYPNDGTVHNVMMSIK